MYGLILINVTPLNYDLSLITIILKSVRFSYIPKSYFFKNVLASGIIYDCIGIYRLHSQNVKSIPQNQPLCAGSVSVTFYIVILHMNA